MLDIIIPRYILKKDIFNNDHKFIFGLIYTCIKNGTHPVFTNKQIAKLTCLKESIVKDCLYDLEFNCYIKIHKLHDGIQKITIPKGTQFFISQAEQPLTHAINQQLFLSVH